MTRIYSYLRSIFLIISKRTSIRTYLTICICRKCQNNPESWGGTNWNCIQFQNNWRKQSKSKMEEPIEIEIVWGFGNSVLFQYIQGKFEMLFPWTFFLEHFQRSSLLRVIALAMAFKKNIIVLYFVQRRWENECLTTKSRFVMKQISFVFCEDKRIGHVCFDLKIRTI